jgi:tetratricopeptide (TPR) repeat protein
LQRSRSFDISERLAASDPTDAEAQRDLSISYDKLGDVSLQTGAVQEAVDSYRKALDIRERLAASDPTDAQAQRDLMVSHYKLGNVQRELFAYAEAATRYQAGIKVLDRMIAAGQNVERSTRERDILQRRATSTELAAAATVEWLDLLQVPEKQLPKLLPSRCTELAKQQKFDDVAQAAGTLRTMAVDAAKGTANEQQGGLLSNAACGYGLCAGGVQPAEGQELTADQQTSRREFQDLALTCLTEAIAAGYDNFKLMRQDTDLATLHELPEFKALLPQD